MLGVRRRAIGPFGRLARGGGGAGGGAGGDRPTWAPRASAVVDGGDIGLVIRIGRHQIGALGEVYRRYGGSIHDLAARMCGTEKAKELTRDVLVDLWRDPHRFVADGRSLRGSLVSVIHERAVGAARAARQAQPPSAPDLRLAGHRNQPSWAPADTDGDRIRALGAPLPGGERDAILLAYLGGYSYREIAEEFGEPELDVARRIRTGLLRLGRGTAREDS